MRNKPFRLPARAGLTLIFSILAGLATGPVQATEQDSAFDPVALAEKLPETGEIHLGLFREDEPDGFMRLGWFNENETLQIYDRTMMPSAEVYESMSAQLDADNLTPQAVEIIFHQGTANLLISARMDEGKVVGTRTVRRPAQDDQVVELDLPLPDGAQLRAITFLLPLVLALDEGRSVSYDWYAPLGHSVQNVSLLASDGGIVETPAGTFSTIKYELRGGSPENDIYVSRETPARIVRIDVLGQALKFLAVP